jgi:hypothetical protein
LSFNAIKTSKTPGMVNSISLNPLLSRTQSTQLDLVKSRDGICLQARPVLVVWPWERKMENALTGGCQFRIFKLQSTRSIKLILIK